MNYEDMTDPQINEAVTKSIGDKVDSAFGAILIRDLGINNYCNDWAYGGLIIQNAKIEIKFDGGFTDMWEACHVKHLNEYDVEYIGGVCHKNPLRAAMIVYLMMQEQK